MSRSVRISGGRKIISAAHAPTARRFSRCNESVDKKVRNPHYKIPTDVHGRVPIQGAEDDPPSTYSYTANPSAPIFRGLSGMNGDTKCNNQDEILRREEGVPAQK